MAPMRRSPGAFSQERVTRRAGRPRRPWPTAGNALQVAAVVVAIGVAWASPRDARADSGAALVAIVTADPGSSLTRRVRAELQSLGVDVLVLKPPDEGSTSRGPLERAARSVGAIAAVRLVPSSEGKVEVWVADRVTGKAVVRELDATDSSASEAAVALGTVELLRASLMELHASEPPHGDAPATGAVMSLALPAPLRSPPRLGLGIGAGAELGLRGLGPSAVAAVTVWVRVAPHLGLRAIGLTSISPARVTAPSGAVDVRADSLGIAAEYAFAGASSAWTPWRTAGFEAAHVSAAGAASPPFTASTQAAWAAAPVAGAGIAWAFVPGLRVRADALAAWAVPAIRVHAPATDARSWGAPAVTLAVGAEVLWGP